MSVITAKWHDFRPAFVGSERGRSVKSLYSPVFGSCFTVSWNQVLSPGVYLTRPATACSNFSTSISSRFLFCALACFLGFVGLVRPVISGAILKRRRRALSQILGIKILVLQLFAGQIWRQAERRRYSHRLCQGKILGSLPSSEPQIVEIGAAHSLIHYAHSLILQLSGWPKRTM